MGLPLSFAASCSSTDSLSASKALSCDHVGRCALGDGFDEALRLAFDLSGSRFELRAVSGRSAAEHGRGNLELFKIGRQYFTTRRHIEAMMEKCRLQAPPRAPKGGTTNNWPEEMRNRAALEAVRLTVEKLKAAGRKKR